MQNVSRSVLRVLAIVPAMLFSTFAAAACTFSTMSFGVFAGASRPYQPLTAKSGMPASAVVGTSGRPGARFSAAIARPFIFPDLTCGVMMEITDHM